jgi:cell division protein FtsB
MGVMALQVQISQESVLAELARLYLENMALKREVERLKVFEPVPQEGGPNE